MDNKASFVLGFSLLGFFFPPKKITKQKQAKKQTSFSLLKTKLWIYFQRPDSLSVLQLRSATAGCRLTEVVEWI